MGHHKPKPSRCDWKADEDGVWHTDCGHAYQFTDGGPADNGQKFCGYCGAPLKEIPLGAART